MSKGGNLSDSYKIINVWGGKEWGKYVALKWCIQLSDVFESISKTSSILFFST
jgi:hypothetical protein